MKAVAAVLGALFLLPSLAIGGDAISINVTNVTINAERQRREATVDIVLPDGISLSKGATLLAIVGVDKEGGPADEFGPPQNVALRGTSAEITPRHFQVTVALPMERVTIRLILREDKRVLADEKRTI